MSSRPSRKGRSDGPDKACLQCQRRKTRCVPDAHGGACTYCTKMGKSCEFGSTPERTPLTRKNLDETEARCRALEALVQKLDPTLNIPGELQPTPGPPNTFQDQKQHQRPQIHDQPADEGVTSYNWDESPSTGQVQMLENGHSTQTNAARQAEVSGYLGNSSTHGLLSSLSSLISVDPHDLNHIGDDPVQQAASMSIDLTNSARISSALLQQHLIQAYFTGYNASYPIIHQQTFLNECSRRSEIPGRSSWHIIYYAVLAVGEWISGFCTDEPSVYYEAARTRIGIEILESGSLEIVQALLLLGNYLQKRDRPNTGYNFIGLAYRVALGLGLHREIAATHANPTFAVHRRRQIFWTLYCFDSGFAITTGRPTLVADTFIDAQKPRNVDDTVSSGPQTILNDVSYPTNNSAISYQARLATIANKIYSTFFAAKAPNDVDHSTSVMEHSIQNWRNSLPDYFELADVPRWFLGPRQVLLWKEANTRILLLLASQRHQTDQQEKASIGRRCQSVATKTVADITAFVQNNADVVHMGISWYAVYFLLQATLAYRVNQLRWQEPTRRQTQNGTREEPGEAWNSLYKSACECLRTLGASNAAALRSLRLLERLQHGSMQASPRQGASTSLADFNHLPNPSAALIQTIAPATKTPIPVTTQPNSAALGFTTDTSPAEIMATNFVEGDWVGLIDPSLHVFFDHFDNIGAFTDSSQGFPNVMEQDDFSYITSGISTVRGPAARTDSNNRNGLGGEFSII